MALIVRWTAVVVLLGMLVPGSPALRSASAAVLIVGPSGFATVQQAVNVATPGTAIVIAPGTYNETVNVSLMGSAAGGTTGALALVAQQGPGTVTLGGAGLRIFNSAAFNGSLLVDGLTLSSSDDDAVRLSSFSDLVLVNTTFQAVGNSNQDNAVELAISVGAPQVVLANNTFRLGTATGGAIGRMLSVNATAASAPTITMQGNTSSEAGLRVGSTARVQVALGGAGGSVTVRDNTFAQSPRGGVVVSASEAGAKRIAVLNNSFTGLEATGITLAAADILTPVDAYVADNTLAAPASASLVDGIIVTTNGLLAGRILRNSLSQLSGRGINVQSQGPVTPAAPDVLELRGNRVTGVGRSAIRLEASGANLLDAAVVDNQVSQPNTSAGAAESGLSALSGGTARVRLALTANTIDADPAGRSVVLNRATSAVLELEGAAALTPQQNIAAANTLAGSVALSGSVAIIEPNRIPRLPAENRAPAAGDDSATALSATLARIDVLANDNDPDGVQVLGFVLPISRAGGTAAGGAGSVAYLSPPGYVGGDVVYYVVADARPTTAFGRLFVDVLAQPAATPTPPVATPTPPVATPAPPGPSSTPAPAPTPAPGPTEIAPATPRRFLPMISNMPARQYVP